jgi:tyrosyl-tRNA synthetase
MISGLDGRKMSTSWGNVINIADSPDEQYGKVMSMHDDQIVNYFILATDVSRETIAGYGKDLQGGRVNPKTIKEKLAFEIVKRYHGEKVAEKAAEKWKKLFSKKDLSGSELEPLRLSGAAILRPGDAGSQIGEISPIELVMSSHVVKSKGEAGRLIRQGGLSINGERCRNSLKPVYVKAGDSVKIGKHRFFRIKV